MNKAIDGSGVVGYMALDAKALNEPGIAKHGIILRFVGCVLACTTHVVAQESPYADGFPPPEPSSKALAIGLTRNEQGLLVRSEKSHEEAAATVRDYLQKVREHPSAHAGFRTIVRVFEPLGFGRREPTLEHFDKSLKGYETGFGVD